MAGVSILGIDPGLSGALAILHPKDGILLESMPVIGNELDLKRLNEFLKDWAMDIRTAYLEKVHSMPKQGVASTFKFGRVYGALEALLVANAIPVIDVRPQVWMKTMHFGISPTLDTKARSRLAFAKRFPDVDARRSAKCRVDDIGMIESALIASYGAEQ